MKPQHLDSREQSAQSFDHSQVSHKLKEEMEIFRVEFETFAVDKEERLRHKANSMGAGPSTRSSEHTGTKQVIPC